MAIVSKMNLEVTPERVEEQRRRKKKRSPRGSLACATFQVSKGFIDFIIIIITCIINNLWSLCKIP